MASATGRVLARTVLAGVITVLITSIGLSSGAYAASPKPDATTQAVISAIRAKLTSFGVTAGVQDQLVAKLMRGQLPDSDTGAAPVSTSTKTEGGNVVTRYEYADGSVAIGSMEQPSTAPTGGVAPNSITGCYETVNYDVHEFTNCYVNWDAVSWSMNYRAHYDYYQFGEDIYSINSVHVGGVGSFGGVGSDISVPSANSSGVAQGEGHAQQSLTVFGVGTTRTIGVVLKVNTRWSRQAQESSFG